MGSLCVKSATGNCAGSTAGTVYATTTTITAADLAEHMPIRDDSLQPGDVVVTLADKAARADQAESRADRAEAESAQLKAESAQLKAAICSKFPDINLCQH